MISLSLSTLPSSLNHLNFESKSWASIALWSVAVRSYSCPNWQWRQSIYTFLYCLNDFNLFFEYERILIVFGNFSLQGFYLLIIIFNLHKVFLFFLSNFLLRLCQFLYLILSGLQGFIQLAHFFLKKFYLYVLGINIVFYVMIALHWSWTIELRFLIYSSISLFICGSCFKRRS